MSKDTKQNESTLVDTYNQMMAHVRDSIDNAEAHAIPSLQLAVEQAKKQAIHLGEVSIEEAEEIANYIKRDVNDAAEYLMETSHEFSEWLRLDINIIEQKVIELFLSVADQTRIELEQLANSAFTESRLYKSGEITAPGSLVCNQCEQVILLNTTSIIPDCSQCDGQLFHRSDI